jgi:hypothetical protein
MFDTFSDDELVERTQFYGSELGRLSNLGYNLTEPCNGSINSLRFNKLMRRCQYIESLQRHRTKYDAEDDTKEESGDRDEDEDDDKTFPLPHLYSQEEVHPCYRDYNYLADTLPLITYPDDDDTVHLLPQPLQLLIQPQPIPLPLDTFVSRFTAAKPHCRREKCYYLGSPIRRRRQPKLRTRTTSPPDTRLPNPLPEAPNIGTRCKRNSNRQTLIMSQQPQCPLQIQPPRKHPPHPTCPVHQLPLKKPCHHLNAQRRIARKKPAYHHSHFQCSRTNITREGSTGVIDAHSLPYISPQDIPKLSYNQLYTIPISSFLFFSFPSPCFPYHSFILHTTLIISFRHFFFLHLSLVDICFRMFEDEHFLKGAGCGSARAVHYK